MIFENQFSRMERLLHHFAFRTGFSQVLLADLEDSIFREAIDSVRLDRPVFISGLPRSGTTILLHILNDSGHFASHTYQDMPFVLCPLLWHRFSQHFAIDRPPRERAHGDRIRISLRSPEGFEEIVWKQFWRDHYRDDRIEPWTASDYNEEFNGFFRNHMAKIVACRQGGNGTRLRYLSKNNVNIARLAAPPEPLGAGIFIVPFRDPFQQAASMLLQHRRFSELHQEDGFARRYMEGIGHHDFGLDLCPIDFGGWLDGAASPDSIEFWIRYWTATYTHVLAERTPSVRLVAYGQLASNPELAMRHLADAVEIPRKQLLPLARSLRPARAHEVQPEEISREAYCKASEVYSELRDASEARV